MYTTFIFFNFIYWILFFIPLKRHSGESIFWKMPHVYLWIAAYLLGWLYITNHFFFLHYFDNVLFSNIRHPIFMNLYVTIHFIYVGSSLLVLGNETSSRLITGLKGGVVIMYLASLVNTNHNDDYIRVYLINTIFLYMMAICSYFALLEINKKKKVIIANTIEAIHSVWYMLFSSLWGIAYFINAINSLYLLLNPSNIKDYQGNTLAQVLNGFSMVCIGIMMLEDSNLYYTSYPIRIWQRWRLKKQYLILVKKLEDIIEVRSAEKFTSKVDADLRMLTILILDYYPFLPEDDPLKQHLEKVEAEGKSLDNIAWKIIQIQIF